MTTSLLDVLQLTDSGQQGRIYGVVVGIVTNNQDPDGMARVRVRFPWLSASDESWWARIAAPMAGAGRGAYFLPEVDDEVLVAFEHGDVRFPYILGAMWNGKHDPPIKNENGKNDIRVIRSRSGHIIRLDDSSDGAKIEIIDKTGENSMVINAAANTIRLKSKSDICLESAEGKVIIKGTSVEIESTAEGVTLRPLVWI